MSVPEWKDRLAMLIVCGHPENSAKITEDSAEEAIFLIRKGAKESPKFLLRETNIAVANGYKNMASIIVATIFSIADESFLSEPETKYKLIDVLVRLDAGDIEEIAEILRKSKKGRGLGSRPQKIMRAAMEEWSFEKIKINCVTQSSQMYNLLRLIHPRYKDRKAHLVKKLIRSN